MNKLWTRVAVVCAVVGANLVVWALILGRESPAYFWLLIAANPLLLIASCYFLYHLHCNFAAAKERQQAMQENHAAAMDRARKKREAMDARFDASWRSDRIDRIGK